MPFLEEKVDQLEKALEELKFVVKNIQQSSKADKIYSVKQIAMRLGLTPAGVNYRIREKHLKASGGRCKKITEEDLLVFEKNYINKNPE